MKKRCLLGLLLLTPILAHADPLNNGALGALALLALIALLFTGLTLLLMVLAFLRPASQLLQRTQGAFLVVFGWLYLSWFRSLLHITQGSLYPDLASAIFPLAMLLNGLTQAKQARQHLACQAWAGLALAGSEGLLRLLVRVLELKTFWLSGPRNDGFYLLWRDAVMFLVSAFSWVLVLALLRRQPAPAASLWQSWWRTPAVGAGMSVVLYLFNMVSLFHGEPGISIDLVALLPSSLLMFSSCWLAGVVVLRLIHPLVQVPEAVD